MTLESSPAPQPAILAVLVLYGRQPEESESLSSILRIFEKQPSLARQFSLVLYDNSPEFQGFHSAIIPVSYIHEPSNKGLATAYNHALLQAERNGQEWLLLLDQDTSLTRDFFEELLEATQALESHRAVASIVPKLVGHGRVYSPSWDFVVQMRRQYVRSTHALPLNTIGVLAQRVSAYNSGACLRVSTLRAIGGFPEEYWLDYLDHAVFHDLWRCGSQMYVMRAVLQHDASLATMNMVPLWRQRNILAAQTRFIRKAGNSFDRFLYRIYLLRYSRKLRTLYSDRRLWRETALQALLWRLPVDERPNSPSSPREKD
jgi:GT2 family glycosyltransferase